MTTTEALAFLRAHQPMPGDWEISDAEGEAFAAILRHFEQHPDERCLPLLVGSVSALTGLGMYQHIRFVLNCFAADVVGPYILRALLSPEPGVRRWGVDWALDRPWPELLPHLRRIAASVEDEDAHELARAAIDAIANAAASPCAPQCTGREGAAEGGSMG
jgi:hypothetical protein